MTKKVGIIGAGISGLTLGVQHTHLPANWLVPWQADFVRFEHNRLAACGDWCVAGRVEGAFLSANALAKQMV